MVLPSYIDNEIALLATEKHICISLAEQSQYGDTIITSHMKVNGEVWKRYK
jgi:hypothetical protein